MAKRRRGATPPSHCAPDSGPLRRIRLPATWADRDDVSLEQLALLHSTVALGLPAGNLSVIEDKVVADLLRVGDLHVRMHLAGRVVATPDGVEARVPLAAAVSDIADLVKVW